MPRRCERIRTWGCQEHNTSKVPAWEDAQAAAAVVAVVALVEMIRQKPLTGVGCTRPPAVSAFAPSALCPQAQPPDQTEQTGLSRALKSARQRVENANSYYDALGSVVETLVGPAIPWGRHSCPTCLSTCYLFHLSCLSPVLMRTSLNPRCQDISSSFSLCQTCVPQDHHSVRIGFTGGEERLA